MSGGGPEQPRGPADAHASPDRRTPATSHTSAAAPGDLSAGAVAAGASAVPASDASPAGATGAAAARPPRRFARTRRVARIGTASVLALAFVLIALLAFVLTQQRGTAWLLPRLPGVEVTKPHGALLGKTFGAEKLLLRWSGGEVTIEDFEIDGARWRWYPRTNVYAALTADRLTARRIAIARPAEREGTTASPPVSLRTPVDLDLGTVSVDTLELPGLDKPIRELRTGRIQAGADSGKEHRLSDVQLQWDAIRAKADAILKTDAPFELDFQLAASQAREPAWSSSWTARGPLAELALQGQLQGVLRPSQPAQSMALKATARPFEPWPLGELDLTTQDLDMAALADGAPHTRLAGTVSVTRATPTAPFDAVIDLRNTAPGSWDRGRAPVSRVQARLKAALPIASEAAPGAADSAGAASASAPSASSAPASRSGVAPSAPTRALPGSGVAGDSASAAPAPRVDIQQLQIDLADETRAAGQISGQGQWVGDELKLGTRWDALQAHRLDARAPELTLSGPLTIAVSGLPAPGTGAAEPPGAGPRAGPTAASAATAAAPARQPEPRPLAITLGGELASRIDAKAVSVALDGTVTLPPVLRAQTAQAAPSGSGPAATTAPATPRASATPQAIHIDLRRLEARSGASVARAQLQAEHGGRFGAAWRVQTQGTLAQFDPGVWVQLPAAKSAPSAGRPPARTRLAGELNGRWTLDSTLPDSALSGTPIAILSQLRGSGRLQLDPSRLQGVPLAADFQLRQDPQASPAERSRLDGTLTAADNRLDLQARGNPAGTGASDRVELKLQAPALAQLAPLLALVPAAADYTPSAGRADVHARVEGRWPSLRTTGTLQAQGLAMPALRLGRADGNWAVSTNGVDAPLTVRLQASDLAYGQNLASQLRVDADGSLGRHTLRIDVATPGRPAGIVAQVMALEGAGGTQARLVGDGTWSAASRGDPFMGGGTWRLNVGALSAGGWDGRSDVRTLAEPDARWLRVEPTQALVRFGPGLAVQDAQLDAGRARLAQDAQLVWDSARWQPGPGLGRGQLKARLDPLLVVPYLNRAKLSYQFAGDLRLRASVDVRTGSSLEADVLVERAGGDLRIIDTGMTQTLGLEELRIAASAHGGVWRIEPHLIGENVGVVGGNLTARTGPADLFPGPTAPLQGTLQVAVPKLGVWTNWLPPGWRLGGAMATNVDISGTVGDPLVRGEMRANAVSVRNVLEGVDVRDGQARVTFSGNRLKVDEFLLHGAGGQGQLSVTGDGVLTGTPSMQLRIRADAFKLLARLDRQATISGDATLAVQDDKVDLAGALKVDSGLFDIGRSGAPALDDDVVVRQRTADGQAATGTAPPPSPLLARSRVSLQLDLGEKLRLRGRGLDTLLRGRLTFTTPGGRLSATGNVRTAEGTYIAYGQKMAIERGVIRFAGPIDVPTLDILAVRSDLEQRVGVTIIGTPAAPRVRLYSDPEMSDSDKLAWLILGRAPDSVGGEDAVILQRAALALLSGEGEGTSTKVLRQLGIDTLSVRQGNGDVRETVVTIGKQISRRWYVGYERGIETATGTWQLIYRIAQRFTFRLQAGESQSADFIWTWRFDSLKAPFATTEPDAIERQRQRRQLRAAERAAAASAAAAAASGTSGTSAPSPSAAPAAPAASTPADEKKRIRLP